MRWEFAILCGAALAAGLLGLGYLAACMGARRWLKFREWWSESGFDGAKGGSDG